MGGVLSRLTDRRDVVFGAVVSGRPEHLAGVEGMVGLFINTVPVVHRFAGTDTVVPPGAPSGWPGFGSTIHW